jgi:hypothetical protein
MENESRRTVKLACENEEVWKEITELLSTKITDAVSLQVPRF